jgi:hypothetical protein
VCLGDGEGAFICGDVSTDTNRTNDVALGDIDDDGNLDAVFANEGPRNRVCLGDGTGGFACRDVSTDTNSSIDLALGDVNRDNRLDAVFGNIGGRNRVCLGNGSGGFSCSNVSADSNNTLGVAVGDVDGNGRLDVAFSNDNQRNRVCLGNGSGGFACSDVDRNGDLDAVFANTGQRDQVCLGTGSGRFTCSDLSTEAADSHNLAVAPGHRGTFFDDDFSVFEADIEWMAGEGITKGCNPPVNDQYCPGSSVTRSQMAAFLVRALDLTDTLPDPFTDDDGSIFEADIEKLAAAGITKGCNPPTNDRFCPDSKVTRGQMAAFLVRALGYVDDGGGNLFIDDDDSIFEGDIDKLGTAGVTKGCNPPTNNMYCPDGFVTRGQMAAFLHRALG